MDLIFFVVKNVFKNLERNNKMSSNKVKVISLLFCCIIFFLCSFKIGFEYTVMFLIMIIGVFIFISLMEILESFNEIKENLKRIYKEKM